MRNQNVTDYLKPRALRLKLLEAMWEDPKVQCYNDTDLPKNADWSVFLNGPTSRNQILEFNHRCLSVHYLRKAGFKGWIYAPEPRGQEKPGDFTEKDYIYNWESSRRFIAGCNCFWIPRDGNELLGLNSNLEFGIDIGMTLVRKGKRKVVVGWPPSAARMGLPNHYRNKAKIPYFNDQQAMCEHIASILA